MSPSIFPCLDFTTKNHQSSLLSFSRPVRIPGTPNQLGLLQIRYHIPRIPLSNQRRLLKSSKVRQSYYIGEKPAKNHPVKDVLYGIIGYATKER